MVASTTRCTKKSEVVSLARRIDLDRSTLVDWVGQTARLMRPLVEPVGTHVMSADRVYADDTAVPVLAPGRGLTHTGRLWRYAR
ncbi:MAG: transposase [Rhodopila sp.]|nr:transposase [Rhodopila sp.]